MGSHGIPQNFLNDPAPAPAHVGQMGQFDVGGAILDDECDGRVGRHGRLFRWAGTDTGAGHVLLSPLRRSCWGARMRHAALFSLVLHSVGTNSGIGHLLKTFPSANFYIFVQRRSLNERECAVFLLSNRTQSTPKAPKSRVVDRCAVVVHQPPLIYTQGTDNIQKRRNRKRGRI
jgi:hypothetical protein